MLLENYKYYYSHYSYLNEYIYRCSPFATGRYDHFGGEDFLQVFIPNDDGTPSNVPMIMSDLDVTREEYYTDSDGNHHSRTVTVYNGTLAKIDFPFEFKCSLSINCQIANTEKITLEDISFNKHFKIYSDNEIEAFLILTPTLITKLKAFILKAGRFELVMRGDCLYFSFDRKNILELNPKETPKNIFDRIYNDIDMIISIVEEIKNNNKVFKM